MCVNPLAIAGGFFLSALVPNYNYTFSQNNYMLAIT